MDLDRGAIHFSGHLKGWALKSRLFGPKWHSLCTFPFQGQKSLDFRAHPFAGPLLWITPPSKSLCPAPYKKQVH